MLVNQNIEVHGDKTVLVPYESNLVEKYHQWMQSEELLISTASEPLTLEEEYEMQSSWRRDDDKLTFIVLDKGKVFEGEVAAMIGDTNLFLVEEDVAEVMLMIAEIDYRRKGYGTEALALMLLYGIEHVGIKQYLAKISMDNKASMLLFEKLGFTVFETSFTFREITYRRLVCDEWRAELKAMVPSFKVVNRS